METLDCIVIGAGPAGLTAATYLARFRRNVVVLDAGQSRARWIPVSHNCPGFPVGVEGQQLLAQLRAQAERFGVAIRAARVVDVSGVEGEFVVHGEGHTVWRAKSVLMAAGIVDRLPDGEGLEDAIASGALRLCAVCDGYEAQDESIGVYAPVAEAIGHAVFLRTFSRDVSVLSPDLKAPSADELRRASDAQIKLYRGVERLRFSESGCIAEQADGTSIHLQTVYPVLGCIPSTGPTASLGLALDAAGKITVNDAMETSVQGVFAAGDVVSGLNQISVAVGHAAVAATSIHHRLAPNWRTGDGDVDSSRNFDRPTI